MGDIDLQESYEQAIKDGTELLNINDNFSPQFCTFVETIQKLPSQNIEQVQTLFKDLNQEIKRYNEQYTILVNELGVLCPDDPEGDAAKRFFSAFLDLCRLAYGKFKDYPDLQIFFHSLQPLVRLLKTNTFELPQEQNVSNALLVQLTKSAHYLSKNKLSLDAQAKAYRKEGGKMKKNTTRKRRKY